MEFVKLKNSWLNLTHILQVQEVRRGQGTEIDELLVFMRDRGHAVAVSDREDITKLLTILKHREVVD